MAIFHVMQIRKVKQSDSSEGFAFVLWHIFVPSDVEAGQCFATALTQKPNPQCHLNPDAVRIFKCPSSGRIHHANVVRNFFAEGFFTEGNKENEELTWNFAKAW